MTGLEQILKQIEDEAAGNAAKEIALGEEKVREILSRAKAEADEKCKAIAAQSVLDVKAVKSRGESAANLYEKKMILKAKQDIISEVIEESKERLNNLSVDQYFATILKLVEKNALNKDGTLLLSAKDMGRLPQEFEENLIASLKNIQHAKLTVAEYKNTLSGGFVLAYGDIEINCSFESLIASKRERLQDKVCEVLFV